MMSKKKLTILYNIINVINLILVSNSDVPNEYGCCDTQGVKAIAIQGRMQRQRERCIGMTDRERAWRAQWLKDQILHGEPIIPENYYRERYNPIRRFYRAPLEVFEKAITPFIGANKAWITRHLIAKLSFSIMFAYATHYYFKYNTGDWTHRGGWKVTVSRKALYPGDKDFPKIIEKKPHEYATFGFENSPI